MFVSDPRQRVLDAESGRVVVDTRSDDVAAPAVEFQTGTPPSCRRCLVGPGHCMLLSQICAADAAPCNHWVFAVAQRKNGNERELRHLGQKQSHVECIAWYLTDYLDLTTGLGFGR